MYSFSRWLRFRIVPPGVSMLLLAAGWFAPLPSIHGGEATLYRDAWGVPHIWAEDYGAAGYAVGQAQCQDSLQNVIYCLHAGVGRLAEVFGPSKLAADTDARKLRHAVYARQAWPNLQAPVRQLIEGYCAGVNRYISTHPEELPVEIAPVTPIQVLAWQRSMLMLSTVGIVKADAEASKSDGYHPAAESKREESETATPVAQGDPAGHPGVAPGKSNSWALSPTKTASGHTMLLIDPHWPAEGHLQLYEFYVHVQDGMQVGGYAGTGTPLPALAVTPHAAWTFTAGGADSSDAYALEIHPENPDQYRWEDAWETMDVRQEIVRVRQDDGSLQPVEVRVRETRHGPVLETESGVPFAAAMGGYRQSDCFDQLFLMATARSTAEFKQAIAHDRLSYFNLMWATAQGDIGYVQTGQAPLRPPGFNWERMVPGWTAASLYAGQLPFHQLPTVENPPSGFLQNCNVAANVVTPGLSFTKDDFPPNVLWGHYGAYRARGSRATELLTRQHRVDDRDARRIAFDTYVPPADLWVPVILQAYLEETQSPVKNSSGSADGEEPASLAARRSSAGPGFSEDLVTVVQLLGGWDRFATRDSVGATLFRFWRLACLEFESGVGRDSFQIPNTPAVRRDALAALEQAIVRLRDNYGRVDVPWGQVKRLQRGDQQWALSGDGLGKLGMDTLRATAGDAFNDQHQIIANGGQCVTSVVTLSDPPTIQAVVAYGQSNKPGAPHYADQAALYAQERFRQVPWTLEQLLPQIESQETYRYDFRNSQLNSPDSRTHE